MNTEPSIPVARRPWPPLAPVLALGVALAILVWGQTLRFGFVWDDTYFVVKNAALRSWSNLPAYFYDRATSAGDNRADEFLVFRPLRNISYLFDFTVAGLNPAWWHLHQILLHAVNALLVGLVASRLARNRLAGVVGGLIFLVHPVQTEVVAWVKGRDDLLAAFWILLAFWLWLRWRGGTFGCRRCAILTTLYGLACLAKDQAIVLPLLLAAADRWLPAPDIAPARRAGFRLWAPMALAGIVYLVWRAHFMGRTSQTDYLDGFCPTMLTMLPVAVKYLQLLVCPVHLLADYAGIVPCRSPLEFRVWGSVLLLAALAMLAGRGRARFPALTFGLVWVVIALLPVSNVVPMMQYMAERFLYFPMIGFACSAGACAAALASRRRTATLVVSAVILAAGAWQAWARATVWKDEVSLFSVTVRDTPGTVIRARRNLLAALLRAGDYARARPIAEELWSKARSDASVAPRKRAEYARHLGMIAFRTGDAAAGREMMNRALALDPTYVEPYLALGMDAGVSGDDQAALGWFSRAVRADPTSAAAHYNFGVALQQLGRRDEAEAAFRAAIDEHPDDPGAHQALAALLWARGDIAATIPIYREASRLWPQDQEIRNWLAKAQQTADQPAASGRTDAPAADAAPSER